MNQVTDIAEINVALPAEKAGVAALFADTDRVDAIINAIVEEVRSHAPDLTTSAGRKAIGSLAAKVARSKTTLDNAGKDLNADIRAQMGAVDAERRKIRERLDALRDEVRKPLSDWENAEKARVQNIRTEIEGFERHRFTVLSPSADIDARITDFEQLDLTKGYDEFQEAAEIAVHRTVKVLKTLLEGARKREADERELAELRRQQAERDRQMAAERAAAEAREREERQKREAAEAEAKALREEQERAQHEEALRKQAAAKAIEDERNRQAAERAEEEARERRRAESSRRQNAIRRSIADALTEIPELTPVAVADAIVAGQIPNITVRF